MEDTKTDMDKIEKIRQEIEKLKKDNEISEYEDYAQYELDISCGYEMELDDILGILSTLESEKPMNLDDFEKALDNECKRYFNSMTPEQFLNTPNTVVARHFAEWGADHFREVTKMVETPNDLEEAAWDCVLDSVDVNNPVLLPKYKELLTYLFIAGAKWDREQMMEEAVEGEVVSTSDNGWECIRIYKKLHKCDDKVRIILVKED